MKNNILIYLSFSLLSLLVGSTFAEDSKDVLQFACRPEYDYFSVQALNLAYRTTVSGSSLIILEKNPDDTPVADAAEKDGFYIAENLYDRPYSCQLQGRTIKAVITSMSPSSANPNKCVMINEYEMKISQNGKTIHTFRPFGTARCISSELRQIKITGNSLQECVGKDLGWANLGNQCSSTVIIKQ